jgi:Na+/H+-dicarboxylate symporter
MKTFYTVTSVALLMGLAVLCCFAPWTSTSPASAAPHNALGYAAIWSAQFSKVPGARVDAGAFAMLAGVVAFFAVVIGGAAYFFRNKRGSEREDV